MKKFLSKNTLIKLKHEDAELVREQLKSGKLDSLFPTYTKTLHAASSFIIVSSVTYPLTHM